jgi:23S rRNA pseudouridine2605 synthase
LAKQIAVSGVASRRKAEKLIEEGKVSVNGEIIRTPVFFVDNSSDITIDGKKLPPQNTKNIIWKFYKPRGVITTRNDPRNRKTVFDCLPYIKDRLLYIGRLDYNSEGLLLFTNNGNIARKLELPATGIKRKYRVKIFGNLTEEKIHKIETGAVINGMKYKPSEIVILEKKQRNTWIEITLSEGKNHEIRKMLEYIGCTVDKLIRISYGSISIKGLHPGDFLKLSKQETNDLMFSGYKNGFKIL